jgi:hypothetical protein
LAQIFSVNILKKIDNLDDGKFLWRQKRQNNDYFSSSVQSLQWSIFIGHFEGAKAFLTPKLSRALLDPGSEIRDGKKSLLWNRNKHPGSRSIDLAMIMILIGIWDR